MNRLIITTMATAVLAGCAFSGSVQKLGPDTYSVGGIGSPMCGGSACAQSAALEQANKHCESLGKEILVTNTSGGVSTGMGHGNAKVTFRCLAKNDRELQRPDYQPAANVIIQDNRK